MQNQLAGRLHDTMPLAFRANVLDLASSSSAGVAVHLDLLVDAWTELMAYETDASAVADGAVDNVLLRASAGAVAGLADGLVGDGELQCGIEEVGQPSDSTSSQLETTHGHSISLVNALQLDLHLGNHVLSPPLLVPSSESVAEDVERVMEPSSLALLEPLLAETIVAASLFGVRQGFVGVADLEMSRNVSAKKEMR